MRSWPLLLVCLPSLAHAEWQFEEKGFRAGAVVFSMVDKNNDEGQPDSSSLISRPGWMVGGWVALRGSDNFAIQFEAAVSQKVLRTEMCGSMVSGGCMTTADLSFYYLELPTVLRLDLLPGATKFFLDLGPEFVVTLGGGEKPPGGEFARYDDLFPINLGVFGGLGLEIPAGPGKIAVDFRYRRWFAPITTDKDMVPNDPNPPRSIHASHHVMLTVGYAFP